MDYQIRAATNADGEAVRGVVRTVLAEFGFALDLTGTDADLNEIESSYAGRVRRAHPRRPDRGHRGTFSSRGRGVRASEDVPARPAPRRRVGQAASERRTGPGAKNGVPPGGARNGQRPAGSDRAVRVGRIPLVHAGALACRRGAGGQRILHGPLTRREAAAFRHTRILRNPPEVRRASSASAVCATGLPRAVLQAGVRSPPQGHFLRKSSTLKVWTEGKTLNTARPPAPSRLSAIEFPVSITSNDLPSAAQ